MGMKSLLLILAITTLILARTDLRAGEMKHESLNTKCILIKRIATSVAKAGCGGAKAKLKAALLLAGARPEDPAMDMIHLQASAGIKKVCALGKLTAKSLIT